ncbi:Signal transduction histidine kinase [Candidatus Frackibacter sp. WG11]|uniref:sensor histidine kinase n=1 Tax=Candidatus Frackibacter sp. WG11 TaxID=2017976 RepID=UPI00088788F9|nr:ATP-binding protein [Candidatus Frackibacter sp. WG11]SDC35436.1 Signal transduction histidine kinase [Candidatus Frackibacter sp. WG11]
MMKVKLWVKLAVIFLLLTISTIALAGGLINIALNRKFADYVAKSAEVKNERIVNSIETIYKEQGNWYGIGQQLIHLEMMTGRRVRITSNKGQRIYNSKDYCKPGGRMNSDMMERGMMGMGMMNNRRSLQKNQGYEYDIDNHQVTKLPIKVNSQVVGHAYITPLNQKGVWSKEDILFRKTINSSIIVAGIIAGIVALLISFFISRRITSPLQKITAVAESMGEGDLSQRVDINSNDEIGVLGERFNQLAANLEKLEKLRKKLTADIAHELRTPLATVQSYVEAFQDGVMPTNEENLNSIHEEVLRLGGLVSDLQELSITEGGKYKLKKEEINLNKFIKTQINSLSQLFTDKNIDLNLDFNESDIKLIADKEVLNKIIHNILSNAYKYSESGDQVFIKVTGKLNEVIIGIRDTGIGIPEKDLPYIFERFYRVDSSRTRKTGGTGIGLAIVKELVEALNGRINVNSKVGEGTEFKIILPIGK